MPNFNGAQYLRCSLESVVCQIYKDWELLIIDDSSTDDSRSIINDYIKRDSRVQCIYLKENCGVSNARNLGISKAVGRYIAFLDSDDLWYSDKLLRQVNFLKNENLPATCSSYDLIDFKGEVIGSRSVSAPFNYSDMLKSNRIGNLTGIYDSYKLGKVFMEDMGHEDYTLWLSIVRRIGCVYPISDSLAQYRISADSLSSSKYKAALWQWDIYRKYLGMSRFKSLYYFVWYACYGFLKSV